MSTLPSFAGALALAVGLTSCDPGLRAGTDPHEGAGCSIGARPASSEVLCGSDTHAPAAAPAHEDAPGRPRDDSPSLPHATASRSLARILEDNASFVHEHGPSYFAPFEIDQHPRVTMVACADSRFHANALDSEPDGDLFVVRNIGNQVDSAEGSVEYGVRHLRTPLLLVVGHVGCGAVKSALGDYGDEPPTIRHELDGLHLSLRGVAHEHGSFEARWQHGVLENVHRQVANATKEYVDLVTSGDLFVVGAVYDFRDEMKGGRGRLHVVSINGERDLGRPPASDLIEEARRAAGIPGP